MGRGASDLTASALAKALDADACEIYTDVTGVFSADPAHRAAGPQAEPDQLRRDARDGRRRVQGAGPALGRVRPQPRRRAARALGVHVGTGHVGHRRTRRHDNPGRARWKIRSSPVSSPTPASPRSPCSACPTGPGISADAVRAARRGQRQRRHDRAEHLDRGQDGHQLHDAVGRHGRRRGHRQPRRPRRSAPPASPTTTTSPRCRVVGAGMKTSPGIAAKMFRTLADEGVNIEMISTSTIRISVVIASADLERAARTPAHRVRPRHRQRLRGAAA